MRKLKRRIRRNNLVQRWRAKTPLFFKKVIKIGLTAGALGVAIMVAPITLPAFMITVAPTLITIGTSTAFVAKFAKEN